MAKGVAAVGPPKTLEIDAALLDSLATAVVVARPPGVLAFMNRAARELTGIDDPPGRSLEEILPEAARTEFDGESSLVNRRTGGEHAVRYIVRPLRDAAGNIVATVATLHDMTALRAVEQEKEQFLSIVSHELRTPLTPLKALAQLLVSRIRRSRGTKQPLDMESLERNLVTIERQVDRMNGLVTDLLSVSRASRGKLEMDRAPFDLAASMRDAVERYVQATREEGRHRFAVESPATLVLSGDEARIEGMLMNLIGNAVKYSPRGGEVRVHLEQRDGRARIVIADQGIGITAVDLPRLGGAFVRGTGKAGTFAGMGIGLHVARLTAEAHGGSLEVVSDGEDRGATVRVELPV